jgi:hypothetical protein
MRRPEEARRPSSGGAMQFANAEGGDDAIFAARGTASATVAMATIFRKDGRILSRVSEAWRSSCGEDGLGEFEGDGCAAEEFFRIGAAGLVGIEDGEGVGDSSRHRAGDGR